MAIQLVRTYVQYAVCRSLSKVRYLYGGDVLVLDVVCFCQGAKLPRSTIELPLLPRNVHLTLRGLFPCDHSARGVPCRLYQRHDIQPEEDTACAMDDGRIFEVPMYCGIS